jgi:hypothetical protein
MKPAGLMITAAAFIRTFFPRVFAGAASRLEYIN